MNTSIASSRETYFTRFEKSLTQFPKWAVLLCYSMLVIMLQFYGPWWVFVLPALFLSFVAGNPRLKKRVAIEIQGWAIASCSSLVWVLMSFVRDVETHWRISPRLAGLFHLPFGVGIYLILALVVFLLSWLGTQIGQTSRYYARLILDGPRR